MVPSHISVLLVYVYYLNSDPEFDKLSSYIFEIQNSYNNKNNENNENNKKNEITK